MAKQRIFKISLETILDLIASSEDFGFYKPVLMSEFAEIIEKKLSDKEIEKFCEYYLKEEPDEEMYLETKDKLLEFRERYCK